MKIKPRIMCTAHKCDHVRRGHCYSSICSNYYRKCPVHKNILEK